jgi:putative oxidoreductase
VVNREMTNMSDALEIFTSTANYPGGARGIALFAFRVTIGVMCLFHSIPKMKTPTTWMSKEGMKDGPASVQAIAAAGELAAGLGLILGALTPFAAAGLAAIMTGALLKVHIPNRSPIVAPPGKPSAETSIDYLFASLLLIAVGPGRYSLDAWLKSGHGG